MQPPQTELPLHATGNGTYDPVLDKARLNTLLHKVFRAMLGGDWWTLAALYVRCGGSEAGLSARIRQLRGMGATIERRRIGTRGLHEYRMAAPPSGRDAP